MDGILLVDKPIFYTSHDIVDVLRHKTGIRRIGHAGTLDPLATGLLVLLVGRSTSLFDRLSGGDKGYEGIMTLGLRTDTQDLEGRITDTRPVGPIAPARIKEVFLNFTGPQTQKIPRFSSARLAGRKCYEMARKKVDFEPREKSVDVKELELIALEEENIYFRTRVSSGTYIRALSDAIGESLGTGACLASLRRVSSGAFRVSEAITIPELLALDASAIRRLLLPAPARETALASVNSSKPTRP